MKDTASFKQHPAHKGEAAESVPKEGEGTISSFITIPADKSVHFAVPHRVRTVHKQHTASQGCGYLRMYRVCIISVGV